MTQAHHAHFLNSLSYALPQLGNPEELLPSNRTGWLEGRGVDRSYRQGHSSGLIQEGSPQRQWNAVYDSEATRGMYEGTGFQEGPCLEPHYMPSPTTPSPISHLWNTPGMANTFSPPSTWMDYSLRNTPLLGQQPLFNFGSPATYNHTSYGQAPVSPQSLYGPPTTVVSEAQPSYPPSTLNSKQQPCPQAMSMQQQAYIRSHELVEGVGSLPNKTTQMQSESSSRVGGRVHMSSIPMPLEVEWIKSGNNGLEIPTFPVYDTPNLNGIDLSIALLPQKAVSELLKRQWQKQELLLESPACCACPSPFSGQKCDGYINGNSQEQVLDHMENFHSSFLSKLECPLLGCCNQPFSDQRALIRHMRNIHYGGGVFCAGCGSKGRIDVMKRHFKGCKKALVWLNHFVRKAKSDQAFRAQGNQAY